MGGEVFHDLNGDGVYQYRVEPGVPHARIIVTGPVTRILYSNANGWWQVGGLPLGRYTVNIIPPPGYTVISPTPLTYTIRRRCEHYLYLYFALVPLPTPTPTPRARVQGYVWLDENRDGLRQQEERGLPGVVVTLERRSQGSAPRAVASADRRETVTDAQGFYSFEDVPPGTYVLTYRRPGGSYPTTRRVVTVNAGYAVVNVDFGVYLLGRREYLPYVSSRSSGP